VELQEERRSAELLLSRAQTGVEDAGVDAVAAVEERRPRTRHEPMKPLALAPVTITVSPFAAPLAISGVPRSSPRRPLSLSQ
jgi:hypothetical protein